MASLSMLLKRKLKADGGALEVLSYWLLALAAGVVAAGGGCTT